LLLIAYKRFEGEETSSDRVFTWLVHRRLCCGVVVVWCGGVLLAWLLHVGMVVWSLTVEVRLAWFVLMVCVVVV
jgi:hypothetical protein